tara:strand:+ start:109 stop:291 length:183 start_codon:yes stop_codon:yes gene_type:complete
LKCFFVIRVRQPKERKKERKKEVNDEFNDEYEWENNERAGRNVSRKYGGNDKKDGKKVWI